MVFIAPLIGATALLSGLVSALPRPMVDLAGRTNSYGSSSSDSSSNYGSSSSSGSSNNYGSSSSSVSSDNYGSSNYGSSNYGSSDDSSASSSVVIDSTSTMMAESSSSMMVDATSTTMMADATSTSTTYNVYTTSSVMVDTTSTAMAYDTTSTAMAYSTPSYGSGSYSSGYDSCVQQCVASFGAPAASATYAATGTSAMGSTGTGATHTIVVAPTQGVLRYVPFALNASVGDTVTFMWGANNHTVTKSSELTPCNKSSEAPVFASGTQNKGFVFNQVINSTETTFLYCGTPGHCPAGMFAIINPPNALGAPTSVAGMMQNLTSTSSDLAAYATYVNNMTTGSSGANWGENIDMASIPDWAQTPMMENVLYTRSVLAANPEILQADGSIDLSNIGSTPLMVPQDVSAVLANAASTPAAGTSSVAGSATASTVAASASSAVASGSPAGAVSTGNGAGITSPQVYIAIMAVVATLFAL